MVLTFDGHSEGPTHGLAGDGVLRLTRVRSSVLVTGLLNDILGRCDSSRCAVELPGEGGGWDGFRGALDLDGVFHLDFRLTFHEDGGRTVWRQKERRMIFNQ